MNLSVEHGTVTANQLVHGVLSTLIREASNVAPEQTVVPQVIAQHRNTGSEGRLMRDRIHFSEERGLNGLMSQHLFPPRCDYTQLRRAERREEAAPSSGSVQEGQAEASFKVILACLSK